MSVADFEGSAAGQRGTTQVPGLSVGERILGAVGGAGANRCSTNLGILLLAPRWRRPPRGRGVPDLRLRLRQVLDTLGRKDAAAVFAAIALANPGGLGETAPSRAPAAEGDPPDAMAEARRRDRIAGQYASAYRDVFRIGLPRLAAARSRWGEEGRGQRDLPRLPVRLSRQPCPAEIRPRRRPDALPARPKA